MMWRAAPAFIPLSRASISASSSVRLFMISAALKSTSARRLAGSLRQTPESKVSRALFTAASTVDLSESTISPICSSEDGLKTAMTPEPWPSTARSMSMVSLNVLHPFAKLLRAGEARCLQVLRFLAFR